MPFGREELFQAEADKCKCPKCGDPDLTVNISCCYDPECCGVMDSVRCGNLDCAWDVEGYFDEDDVETFIKDRGLTLKD